MGPDVLPFVFRIQITGDFSHTHALSLYTEAEGD
jgi:hypothetical protein